MTAFELLLSAMVTLTLIPATAAAAKAPIPPRISPAAQSLAISPLAQAGTKKGKGGHERGLGTLRSLLVVAGAVPAVLVVQDAVDHASGG